MQKEVKGERVISTANSRVFIKATKLRSAQVEAAGHITCTIRKLRGRKASARLTLLRVLDPHAGNSTTLITTGLHTSMNSINVIPHTYAQRLNGSS